MTTHRASYWPFRVGDRVLIREDGPIRYWWRFRFVGWRWVEYTITDRYEWGYRAQRAESHAWRQVPIQPPYWPWKIRKAKRQQNCCIFCTHCRLELISAGGYVEAELDGLEVFRCPRCDVRSWWDFDAPVPILIRREDPANA